jgi:putative SOS response-associated peptidase YedK
MDGDLAGPACFDVPEPLGQQVLLPGPADLLENLPNIHIEMHSSVHPPRPTGRPPPVNTRCEGISTSGMFKKAYASRRCLIPIDGVFEWKDIFGTGKNKQLYAIAMKSGEPFALAGI